VAVTCLYSASILFGHEEAWRERAWPRRQLGESRIVSKLNASPVLYCSGPNLIYLLLY
jgi:hypothetical protein